MIPPYPRWHEYETLYARYLTKGSKHLIDFAQLPSEEAALDVLDLCAGNGRLGIELLESHPNCRVTAVEGNFSMCPKPDARITWHWQDVEDALVQMLSREQCFDVVFCQQAVNYWLDDHYVANLVQKILRPGGCFVFNTFVPSDVWFSTKTYELDGRQYHEINQREGDVLHHVQICRGLSPHLTRFQVLSIEKLKDMLTPYFATITDQRNGPSLLVRCTV